MKDNESEGCNTNDNVILTGGCTHRFVIVRVKVKIYDKIKLQASSKGVCRPPERGLTEQRKKERNRSEARIFVQPLQK